MTTEPPRQSEAIDGSLLDRKAYEHLRQLAAVYMARRAGAGDTLQPTALVHEAYLKLLDSDQSKFKSETHYAAVAALAMRQILIDHARGKNRAKRGGGWQRVTLSDVHNVSIGDQIDVLALDEALTRLADLDPRAARVVELRFFGGLSEVETASYLGVSERTVRNDWSMARAWLRCELGESDESESAGQ